METNTGVELSYPFISCLLTHHVQGRYSDALDAGINFIKRVEAIKASPFEPLLADLGLSDINATAKLVSQRVSALRTLVDAQIAQKAGSLPKRSEAGSSRASSESQTSCSYCSAPGVLWSASAGTEQPQGQCVLQRCSACLAAQYCSRDCQSKHWKQHKPLCKQRGATKGPAVSQQSTPVLKASADVVTGTGQPVQRHQVGESMMPSQPQASSTSTTYETADLSGQPDSCPGQLANDPEWVTRMLG